MKQERVSRSNPGFDLLKVCRKNKITFPYVCNTDHGKSTSDYAPDYVVACEKRTIKKKKLKKRRKLKTKIYNLINFF